MIIEILNRGKNAEIGLIKNKVVIWEITSKTKYEVVTGG